MLTLRSKLEIAGGIVGLVLLAILAVAWQQSKADLAKMQETIKTEAVVVTDASKREVVRDKAASQAVASLETAKKRVQSPTQAVAAIPAVIPLPEPITFAPAAPASKSGGPAALPDAILPAADLKPLYDFGVACQECKVQLRAAQADRADDALKLAAVAKERDAAVTAAKGGSKWTRIKRASKWLAVGAAIGAAAAVAAHH